MKVKIKLTHPEGRIPKYAKQGDAGLDLHAVSKTVDEDGNIVYGTGLAFEIPNGYVGLLFPRSSNAKQDLLLTNSVGVIDSGFRSEVTMKYAPTGKHRARKQPVFFDITRYDNSTESTCKLHHYQIGDRVGQLIILPYPTVEFEEVSELSDSERGQGGYGSTGR